MKMAQLGAQKYKQIMAWNSSLKTDKVNTIYPEVLRPQVVKNTQSITLRNTEY